MLRRATVALVLGGLLFGTAPHGSAAAQEAEQSDIPQAEAPASSPTPKAEGEYSGVSPGEPAKTPDKPTKKARKVASGTLTWIGFSAENGGAELFFQASSRFAASQRVEGNTLVVELDGITRMGPNTRRPLDTRFFETSVARITAKAVRARRGTKKLPARKAGVEVRIAFKSGGAREGSLRTGTEGDGYRVYLDLSPAAGNVSDSGAAKD
jgi:hypothetical protein